MQRVKGIFTLIATREISFDPQWYQNDEQSLSIETIFQRAAKECQEDPCDFVDHDQTKIEVVCRSPEEHAVHEYRLNLGDQLVKVVESTLIYQAREKLIKENLRMQIEYSKLRDSEAILRTRVLQLEQELATTKRQAQEARVEASRLQFPDTTGS